MKNIKRFPLFLIVFGFIVIYSLTCLFLPDKSFSENENKYLAKFPQISWRGLVNGSFATKYEEYVSDQMLFRDGWITAKSLCEFALLKTENNGVVYGKDGYMFPRFYKFDKSTLIKNLDAIGTFSARAYSNVSLMIVPSSYYPLVDKVPAGLPIVDQSFFIKSSYNYLADVCLPVNAKDILSVNANNYIYYRTDHHWTTYGAWLAYTQFAATAGFTPFEYNGSVPIKVPEFFGTSYSKSKAFNAKPDTLEYFDFKGTMTIGDQTYDSIYDTDKLSSRDKYGAFLRGNNGYSTIKSPPSDSKKESILVIKDSFANSMIPFLLNNYNTIVVVDPRYYSGDFKEFFDDRFSDILVLYSFESITTDTSIAKLGL
ncbi:MAG: DHHW family protein [Oscillospiraceae bacterium]